MAPQREAESLLKCTGQEKTIPELSGKDHDDYIILFKIIAFLALFKGRI